MIVFLGGCSNAPRRRGLFFGDQRLRSHVRTQDPLRRGRRRSMGGRGQGEDRRRARRARRPRRALSGDRKSTRLNSSHGYISYAVFCLKKKNKRIASWAATISTIRSVAPIVSLARV